MIAVIDYGASNLRSVLHALAHLEVAARVAQSPDQLDGADAIILPGVGAFGAGMDQLRAAGFEEPLKARVADGVPLLGICLGMQFLFEVSEEMGEHAGLGLLPGRVVRFPEGDLKVPHMGWNQLHHVVGTRHAAMQESLSLLAGVPEGGYAYFVHSFYVRADDPANVLAQTDYGLWFPSVVGHDHVYGVQFHPEKSQRVGLQILRNFAQMVR